VGQLAVGGTEQVCIVQSSWRVVGGGAPKGGQTGDTSRQSYLRYEAAQTRPLTSLALLEAPSNEVALVSTLYRNFSSCLGV
jgi:hypothetical protein